MPHRMWRVQPSETSTETANPTSSSPTALGDTSVFVFRNSSSGAAISFDNPLRFVTASGPYAVAIGDLDGDGKPDLAIANTGSSYVTIYKNTSTPGSISFSNMTDSFGP